MSFAAYESFKGFLGSGGVYSSRLSQQPEMAERKWRKIFGYPYSEITDINVSGSFCKCFFCIIAGTHRRDITYNKVIERGGRI